MDKKKQLNIPKYVWIIAGILVVCIIFLIAVQVPFSQKLGTYNAEHASAAALISQYDDYTRRHDEIKTQVESMKAEYNSKSAEFFINGTMTSDDINIMLNKLGYQFTNLSVQKGVVDASNKKSAAGDPLYKTVVSFNYIGSEDQVLKTLKYFEDGDAKGSYFVTSLNLSPVDDGANTAATDATDVGGDAVDSSAEGSNASAQASTASTTGTSALRYNASISLTLYYFNPTANTGTASSTSSTSSTAA